MEPGLFLQLWQGVFRPRRAFRTAGANHAKEDFQSTANITVSPYPAVGLSILCAEWRALNEIMLAKYLVCDEHADKGFICRLVTVASGDVPSAGVEAETPLTFARKGVLIEDGESISPRPMTDLGENHLFILNSSGHWE